MVTKILFLMVFAALGFPDSLEHFIARFEFAEDGAVVFKSMGWEKGVKWPMVKKAERFESAEEQFTVVALDSAGKEVIRGTTGLRKYLGHAPDMKGVGRTRDPVRTRAFFLPADLPIAKLQFLKSGTVIHEEDFPRILKSELKRILKIRAYFGRESIKSKLSGTADADLSRDALKILASELGNCEFSEEDRVHCELTQKAAAVLSSAAQ